MRKAAVALVVLLILSALPPTGGAAAVPTLVSEGTSLPDGQFRAYWVDAFGPGLYNASQIDGVVAAAKALHMNAIVAEVVRRGDCFCNNALAPRTEQAGVDPAPFDPLQTLIQKAHASGLQVHAWVIATAMWNGTSAPANPQHIFNLHGPYTSGAANWVQTRQDGVQFYNNDWMMDPGDPDVAQWIVDDALSIVRNYDVDGLNLDRIRYPDGNFGTNNPSWGYNPNAIGNFQAATGRHDVPATTDPQFTQWRRDQITSIVRRIYVESYAIKPSVRISADTITYGYGPQHGSGWEGSRAYAEQLQDWAGWMREGILDLNIPMNYKREEDANQSVMYQEWSDFAKDNQFSRQSVVGSALYLNDISSSVQQARIAIAPSSAGNASAGWVGYSYRTPDDLANAGTRSGADSRAALTAALLPVFPSDVPVPTMIWKTAPTKGEIHGTTSPNTQVSLINTANGVIPSVRTSDGKGWFGFVDVAPGVYRLDRSGGTIGYAQVVAGQVASLTATTPSVTPSPSPTNTPTPTPAPSATPAPTCTASVGPGIPAPANVPQGLPGFHAAWYGQSGYPTLCPGQVSTATVAFYNSGSAGWLASAMGQVAYLGTWSPEPGQDKPSPLGGDGTQGTPNTSWPRYNRIAMQPAQWVGPTQVSWFQFTIQAPNAPGTYRLYIRPLIEGAAWLEDYGVYWLVTVK